MVRPHKQYLVLHNTFIGYRPRDFKLSFTVSFGGGANMFGAFRYNDCTEEAEYVELSGNGGVGARGYTLVVR
jgi:hypothetical protein